MRSLFMKVFFWFWLAMTLSGVTLFVIGRATHPGPFSEPFRRKWEQINAQTLTFYGTTAAALLAGQGPRALEDCTAALERATGIRVVLLLRGKAPVLDRQASPGAWRLAAQARRAGTAEVELAGDTPLLAVPIVRQGGDPDVVVGALPMPPPLPFGESTGVLGEIGRFARGVSMPLFVTFVIGGLVCLGLAWHLTAPVRRLRTATQRLAHGDLTARVGAGLVEGGEEIAGLGRDFDVMAARVEQLLTTQQQLLRDISHELRSPLARLTVALELARQCAGETAKAPLDRIEREAARLNQLIGHLLTLTQLDSGDIGTPQDPVSLTCLVEAIAADANFEAATRHCAVQVDIAAHLTVTGSEEMLRRAIENVVRNAVRYTPEHSQVELRVTRHTDPSGDQAWIEVRDHGPGVPADALPRLFLPFYRVAAARDRQTGGAGIGLAITERAVRLHHGTVQAGNASDGGLLVSIRLPLPAS